MVAKTILELAEELKVSKQAIRYHFSDIEDKFFSKRNDGAILISQEAENIIRKKMNQPLEKKVGNTEKKVVNKVVNYQEDTIQWLLSELEAKNDQINQKDEQIERKDDQIDGLSLRIEELTTLISRDQVLLERTIKPFKSEGNKSKEIYATSDESEVKKNDVKPTSQKKNWFQRMFGK